MLFDIDAPYPELLVFKPLDKMTRHKSAGPTD
jgi:hypothetical protein